MPHFPKPFLRPARGLWYVQLLGKQINLGPDREAAFRQYGELISRPAPPKLAPDTVAVSLDLFLDWCKLHREERTYEWYQVRCQSFLDSIPPALTVADLRPFHVQNWVDGKAWNDGMKHGAMIAIQRAFNWLAKQGRIDRSPISGIEKPPAGRREKVVPEVRYLEILALFPDSFGELLQLAWETGARAQELLRLEARHVELDNGRWVFPAAESKGKRRARVIYLTEAALLITKRLVGKYPEGRLLRNEDGVPWASRSSIPYGKVPEDRPDRRRLAHHRRRCADPAGFKECGHVLLGEDDLPADAVVGDLAIAGELVELGGADADLLRGLRDGHRGLLSTASVRTTVPPSRPEAWHQQP
jgi:integrase